MSTTVTLQGSTYLDVTFIASGSTSNNYGQDTLELNTNYRILLRPTAAGLALLPAGSTVTAANITMQTVNSRGGVVKPVQVYQLTKPWVKTTATWYNYDTGLAWTAAGAESDIVASPQVATGSVPINGNTVFTLADAGTFGALVQGFYAGTITNNGVLIAADTTSSTDGEIYSSTYAGNTTYGPALILTVTVPNPTWTITNPTVTNLDTVANIVFSVPYSSGAITGTFNTANITAIAGTDYVAQSGLSVSLPQGTLSQTISVPIIQTPVGTINGQYTSFTMTASSTGGTPPVVTATCSNQGIPSGAQLPVIINMASTFTADVTVAWTSTTVATATGLTLQASSGTATIPTGYTQASFVVTKA